MLAKKYRLPVQKVLNSKSKSYRDSYFTIKSFKSTLTHSRFGVIVSKKIAKTAVERNQIKRMIFQAADSLINKWPVADYLII